MALCSSVSLFFNCGHRRASFSPLSSSNSTAKTNLKHASLCFPNFLRSHSKSPTHARHFVVRTSIKETESDTDKDLGFVGEDSAVFELGKQKISSWIYFTAILGVVLYVLNVAWIDNSTGYGKAFIDAVSSLSDSHEVTLLHFFSNNFRYFVFCVSSSDAYWSIVCSEIKTVNLLFSLKFWYFCPNGWV